MDVKYLIIIFLLTSTYTNAQDPVQQSSDEVKFLIVEKSAEFPGGIEGFYQYISKNLMYPEDAKRQGISGKVFVEFVINEDGHIDRESARVIPADEANKNAPPSPSGTKQVIIDLTESCNMEAIRVVRESPKWIPAMYKGRNVRQKMVVPIVFKTKRK